MATRIITLNLNGIRSAARKDVATWLEKEKPDILCLQELKAQTHQIPVEILQLPYHHYFHPAKRPGYSGVGLLTKTQPDAVYYGISSCFENNDFIQTMDDEGRFLRADFGNTSILSIYFPSGSSSDARQDIKMKFLDVITALLKQLKDAGRQILLCADVNVAHKEIDLKNWRGNQKNSGFLPEERQWMDALLASGFVDVFRQLYPEQESYTWWSNRGKARANNVGWRIDYHIATPAIANNASAGSVYRESWFSDHAPLTIDYSCVISDVR
ncbi:MAG: exodeoxyribonuclease III [Mariprofundales bacterium]